MDLSTERKHVAQALRNLDANIARLVDALAHRPARVTVENATEDRDAIQRACASYSAINYLTHAADETSLVCLGVIGASSDILRRAEAVNAAKTAFKTVCAPLQRINVRVPVSGETQATQVIPAIRVVLRNIQRSDINLLAAYRKIPLLNAPPVSVTYTRANTRAVYRKTIEELYVALNNMKGPVAADDRARLDALDRHETHLALVKDRYQNIRANVLYARLDPRGRGRIQIAAELPLMYPLGRHPQHPVIEFPKTNPSSPGAPQRVRQSQLQPQRYLQSLPVYRYIRV
jgi:hypothetical protein